VVRTELYWPYYHGKKAAGMPGRARRHVTAERESSLKLPFSVRKPAAAALIRLAFSNATNGNTPKAALNHFPPQDKFFFSRVNRRTESHPSPFCHLFRGLPTLGFYLSALPVRRPARSRPPVKVNRPGPSRIPDKEHRGPDRASRTKLLSSSLPFSGKRGWRFSAPPLAHPLPPFIYYFFLKTNGTYLRTGPGSTEA